MFDFFKVQKVTVSEKKEKIITDYTNIDPLAVYVKERIGIDFSDKKSILSSRMKTICKTHNIVSFEECLRVIQTDESFKQDVINYLTTNESFFYRELDQIKSLVQEVKSSSSKVSILCAPSATGEEPYSIVIALLEANVPKDKFSVTGIDISSDAIDKSIAGIYDKNTMRNLSSTIIAKYFHNTEQEYNINKEIKDKVTFKCVNIFDASFQQLGLFDYILSRNMLIYFDKQTKQKAHNIFKSHLKNENEKILYGHADFPPTQV